MQLLDELRREHDLIERVLGALRAYATRLCAGEAGEADGFALLDFLETYAGGWHHAREEDVLFRALESEAGLPLDRGPIAALLADHAAFASRIAMMRRALREHDFPSFASAARDYSSALCAHIDAENSVLFPESEQQLRRRHITELPLVAYAAMPVLDDAEMLIARYGAGDMTDIVRGDGCVMCPAYGDICAGVEREWWNEWQWEELDEHVASS